MGTWLSVDLIKISTIMAAEDKELSQLINLALMDAVTDTMDLHKDEKKPRSVQINLDLKRMDDQVHIDWKVVPKLAPYEKTPPKAAPEKVPEGQMKLFDQEDPLG